MQLNIPNTKEGMHGSPREREQKKPLTIYPLPEVTVISPKPKLHWKLDERMGRETRFPLLGHHQRNVEQISEFLHAAVAGKLQANTSAPWLGTRAVLRVFKIAQTAMQHSQLWKIKLLCCL